MRLLVATALTVLSVTGTAAAQLPPAPTPVPPAPTPVPTVTPAPEPTSQPGVTVAGVDVGGLVERDIRTAIREEVRPVLQRPVKLRSGRVSASLKPGRVKQSLKVDRTVKRVLAAEPDAAVKPVLSFNAKRVRAFVDAYAERVFVAPVDARVRIFVRRIGAARAKDGRKLARRHVAARVRRVLRDPVRSRRLSISLIRARPAVRVRDLPRRYPTIITIDKSTFTLRLFKRMKYDRRYGVAIGQPAYPTPTGLFAIQSKQVNPTWTAPNSPWAGEAAGQSYAAGDPGNPLAARWMGVSGSVGIHGTYQEHSIGSAASHGCIRMRASDVIDLFGRVAIGTPVLIAN